MFSASGKSKPWIVAITGASGMRYALRLVEVLVAHGKEIHLIVSDAALRVLQDEEGIKRSQSSLGVRGLPGITGGGVHFHNPKDIGAPMASGSMFFEGMVIVPCSMNTLAAVSHGLTQNLIHRAADVTLKERRRLILVPRETPLSEIHLENMLRLARLGATILPAMPGFYQQARTIDHLVDGLVMKILDHMGIVTALRPRWPEREPSERASQPELVKASLVEVTGG